jgi:DNA-binding protein H-NS
MILTLPAVPAPQPPARPASTAVAPALAAAPDSTVQAIETFAKLQHAINQLRDKEQAELAEPRSKKVEEQATIRERYRKLRADSLKAHGFTPAQVTAMTLRLSSDDALRTLFETTMERLSK